MNRRKLFLKLGEWAAALGFGALLPTPGEARRLPVPTGEARHLPAPQDEGRHLPVPAQRVHWVSLDRRHIEGRLMEMTPAGKATVQVTVRPPVTLADGSVVTTTQRIEGVVFDPWTTATDRARPNTWHHPEPEGYAQTAKPYAEWWYREKPTDGPGELTPRPAAWFVKRERDTEPVIPADLLAYRIDDADWNYAQLQQAAAARR